MCLDRCHKARPSREAPTTAGRRWDRARERRTSASQASPRCRSPAGSHPDEAEQPRVDLLLVLSEPKSGMERRLFESLKGSPTPRSPWRRFVSIVTAFWKSASPLLQNTKDIVAACLDSITLKIPSRRALSQKTTHQRVFEFHSLGHSEQRSRLLASFLKGYGYSCRLSTHVLFSHHIDIRSTAQTSVCQQHLRPSQKKRRLIVHEQSANVS